ncbi:probable serine/threonine-protein kinase PBL19, partial [Tanacetum coccineum]
GHKEWLTEINVLGVVEHPNLVKLVGYCAEDNVKGTQLLLVYEYMPNQNVRDHLSAKSKTPLSWTMRLKVAQDAARGLTYLHEDMDYQIIFRDFKSSNILLDDHWNAKLSDFGLARLGPQEGRTHISTKFVGTKGYACPEYLATGHLTSKSDVWSYGVFLYELITGRRPLDRNRPQNEQKLLEWVKPYVDSKNLELIIDSRLEVPSHATSPAPHFKSLAVVTAIKWKKGVEGKKTHDDTKNKAERGSSDMQLSAGAHTPQKRSMKLLRSCF